MVELRYPISNTNHGTASSNPIEGYFYSPLLCLFRLRAFGLENYYIKKQYNNEKYSRMIITIIIILIIISIIIIN